MIDPTIWHTPGRGCPACMDRRRHADNERAAYHPYSGHGFDRAQWSHPALDPDHLKKWAAAKAGGGGAHGQVAGVQ